MLVIIIWPRCLTIPNRVLGKLAGGVKKVTGGSGETAGVMRCLKKKEDFVVAPAAGEKEEESMGS